MTRFLSALFAILALSAAALAGPGHDHGPAPAGLAAPAIPRAVAEGTDFELVAVAQGHTLTLYLDRIATNAPVASASIEVSGEGIPPASAKETAPGVYEIEADWADVPGTKPLTFTVIAPDAADLLAGQLVVPEPVVAESGAPFSWVDLARRPEAWALAALIALGGFFLAFAFRPMRIPADAREAEAAPKPQAPGALRGRSSAAALVLVCLAAAAQGGLPGPASAHEGHDHGETGAPVAPGSAPSRLPSGEVFLPKSTQRLLNVRTAPAAVIQTHAGAELIGTVMADPAHEGRVQAPMEGQVELAAGTLSYVGKTVREGDVLARLAPAMPVFDRGSLQQLTAEVEGKLRIAEQKLARLARISGDYIPQREIDDTRTEIESLREQKRVLEPKAGERLDLVAPVSGIISVANVRAGQVVSAKDTLFEIVDPKRLWVEAIGIAGTDDEEAVVSAKAIDGEGHPIALTYIGRAPALRQQALPLLFSVENPHASLAIGSAVKVLVQHGQEVKGIVVPDAAVVRAPSGLSQVWVKLAPERFEPRIVRTSPLDGDRVLVKAGLAAGDRVVVEAAELINQVR